jgi:hypothetical protein
VSPAWEDPKSVRRRIAEYLAGERDEASLQASLRSIVAHVEMGGSPGLRRAILMGQQPPGGDRHGSRGLPVG